MIYYDTKNELGKFVNKGRLDPHSASSPLIFTKFEKAKFYRLKMLHQKIAELEKEVREVEDMTASTCPEIDNPYH